MYVVEYPLESGGSVLVEVVGRSPDVVTRGGRGQQVLERAEQTFDAALGTARRVSETLVGQLRELTSRPDEVQVEFGLQLSATAGAILAAAGTNAQLKVQMTWRQAGSPPPQDSPGPIR